MRYRLGTFICVALMGFGGTAIGQERAFESAPNWVAGEPSVYAVEDWRWEGLAPLTGTGFAQNDYDRYETPPGVSLPTALAPQQRQVWRQRADGGMDQFRIRHRDSLLVGADGLAQIIAQDQRDTALHDMAYIRSWAIDGGQVGGLQVELNPHAGLEVVGDSTAAELGATVRFGNFSVRDGRSYGDQGRWYVFAAGSGQAVGMNILQNAHGGWDRQGMTHDSGTFIGDAQVGVAWRQGPRQASFGYVHREIRADGMVGGRDIDLDHTEGFVAFQFSIRPDW